MDSHPLISFALYIPSRMASLLKSARPDRDSHMVINLLSSERAAVAVKFSRPDLYPEPFRSVPYSLTQEGLPVDRWEHSHVSWCHLRYPCMTWTTWKKGN
jgi:hypothetical protein